MRSDFKLSIRFTGVDAEKMRTIWERALKRTRGQAKQISLIKELLGLAPLNVITQEEIDYLTGRIDALDHGVFSADDMPIPGDVVRFREDPPKRPRH